MLLNSSMTPRVLANLVFPSASVIILTPALRSKRSGLNSLPSRPRGSNAVVNLNPHLTRGISQYTKRVGYWDYSKRFGPKLWHKWFKVGDQQSPIDIVTGNAVHREALRKKPFRLTESGLRLHMINLGFNVAARAMEGHIIPLTGGPLEHEYAFREIHFHWGRTCDVNGAEHTIDGKRYSAEMHIVHWNHQVYEIFNDAVPALYGLTVLGVFIDEGDYPPNPALNNLLDLYEKVSYRDQEYNSTDKFNPYSLLPKSLDKYYTYYGSLTVPPLSESVTWIVFSEPLRVPKAQMDRFRGLKSISLSEVDDPEKVDAHDHMGSCCCGIPTIGNNFREVLPLNKRVVYTSFS